MLGNCFTKVLRSKTIHIALFVLVIFAQAIAFHGCRSFPSGDIDVDVFFSAEKLTEDGKQFYADNDSSVVFNDSRFRTGSTSRSGSYSYRTTPANKFGLSITIPNVKPDNYIRLSVWKNGPETRSHLVAASTTPDIFYKSVQIPTVEDGEWQKLELEFFLPPNYKDKGLKIYVWNNSGDTVYFDDLSIRIQEKKTYPDYKEQGFYIETDTTDFIKLTDIRKQAFDIGILQSEDDHWVRGFVFIDDRMMKTRLRLKGDWLDHLHGDKWSFRLKLKRGNTWKGMRTFSLHTPVSRHGVDEWFLHQVCISQQVLTTRYGFVPVFLLNKNLGLYAWEEHFTKHLLESQSNREGPIIRFFEDVLWDQVRGKKSGIEDMRLPFFEAAVIKPFSSAKIIEDTGMFNQYTIAQNLLYQYKNRTKPASEIFNIDALAKYFALCDVYKGYHSLIWHNQRFYYNPVLCKLEPILFDAYTEMGFFDWVDRNIYGDIRNNSIGIHGDEYLMIRELFNDFTFINAYIRYLGYYSEEAFLLKNEELFGRAAMKYDSLVRLEFPDLNLNLDRLAENALNVRNELPDFTKRVEQRKANNDLWSNVSKSSEEYSDKLDGYYARNLLAAYVMKSEGDSSLIRVVNYFTGPVLLLGFGKTNGKIREFLHPEPELDAYTYKKRITYECWIHEPPGFLFVMAGNNQETVPVEIMPWPEPNGANTPLQELIGNNIFPDPDLLGSWGDQTLKVKPGSIQLDHPVVIPEGYKLVFEAGTRLDMVNGAFIISYSPVEFKGTALSPVRITSSDFTSRGIAVLQTDQPSAVDHTIFENLNTLNYDGWTLTGAVTFYEADVVISNTRFYRNQCEDALNTIRSEFTVTNCDFDYIFGDAFDSDFCKGSVIRTRFTNIGNDAIDFSGSRITIDDVQVNKANDKGISGGEASTLFVKNSRISNANIGIASKDLSTIEVDNTTINDCNYGLVLLRKKPEYGPAVILMRETEIIQPVTDMLIEKGSLVVRDGDTIKGNKEKLADIFYQ
jgi:hypothetical protein